MAKTVSKTIRISQELAHEIETGATKNNISQGQYCVSVFTEYKQYKLQKMFEEDLANMEQDEVYKKEQHELAEADFL